MACNLQSTFITSILPIDIDYEHACLRVKNNRGKILHGIWEH